MSGKRCLQRIKRSALPILCLLFTFFIYGSLELYLANRGSEELWFSYTDVLVPIAAMVIASFIVILILIMPLPSKAYHFAVALITSLGLLMFIQGSFLPNNYGELNGTAIDWGQYSFRRIYNTGIWVVVIAVAVILAFKQWRRFRSVAIYAAAVLLVVETISLAVMGITGTGKGHGAADSSSVFLTTDKEFTVSGGNNTIVFVLDTFDAQIMCDLMAAYPEEIHESFEDFTFYHNTSGGATRTKYAIPYILSGRTNDTGDSYSAYLKESAQSSPLFQELRTGKYDTGLYTEGVYVDRTQTVAIDNLSSNEKLVPTSRLGLTRDFLKMTAFKYMPHILKPAFWMYSFELLQWKGASSGAAPYRLNDIAFHKRFSDAKLTTTGSEPGFRFIHLVGAHGPFIMNGDMQEIPEEEGTEARQALGTLRIVSEYIQQMKQNDVYDNANIFILADHGDWLYGSSDFEQNPLCMIKVAHVNKDFSVSEDRLSFKDLPDMMVDALKNKLVPENYIVPAGMRYFYSATEKNGDYSIVEYASEGDAYDVDSWQTTGMVYSYEKKDYSYKLGTKLYSGILNDCTACQHFVKGFTQSESTFSWTDGEDAEMRFDIGSVDKDLKFVFDYCDVGNHYQRCYLYAADRLIGSRVTEGASTQEYVIPRDCVVDGKLEIRLWMPDAYCPLEHGTGQDRRHLGLAVQTFLLDLTDDPYDAASQMQVELPE